MFIHGWSVSRFILSDQNFQLDIQVFHKKVKKLISSVSSLKRQTCIAFDWKRNSLIQFWENLKRKKIIWAVLHCAKVEGGPSNGWRCFHVLAFGYNLDGMNEKQNYTIEKRTKVVDWHWIDWMKDKRALSKYGKKNL